MEFNNKQLEDYKKSLLKVLMAFQGLCHKHGLTYYACGGTLLGAIRHNGFIPWDDDIDVIMPRKDYDEFVSLKAELLNTDYEIIDNSNNTLYMTFSKFSERNSTIVELEKNPTVIGVSIDVFVFDESDGLEQSRELFEYSHVVESTCVSSYFRYSFWSVLRLLGHFRLREFVRKVYFLLFREKIQKHNNKLLMSNIEDVKKQKGDYYLCYWASYPFKKELHKKELFSGVITVPFENITIDIPLGYDGYLRNIFGDYMTLPPLEQQKCHHNLYFFDLNKRWKSEDVIKMGLDQQQLKSWYKYE